MADAAEQEQQAPGFTFTGDKSTLVTFDVPEGVTHLARSSFIDCRALVTVNLRGVTDIGEGAFAGCHSLPSIDVSNVIDIGRWAFIDCRSLQSISLP